MDEVKELSAKFGKETEEKIIQKMEASLKNREEQLQQMLNRLKDHVRLTTLQFCFKCKCIVVSVPW